RTRPFQISPHDPSVIWLGGNHLFKLEDRGNRWEMASPDLSTRDPAKMATVGSAAETHCTIVTLQESPLERGQVWAGTDDGRLWVTRDGGKKMRQGARELRRRPAGLYMSRIETSHHHAGTAYVAIDGHRTDVVKPFALVTRDYGRSWTSIVGDLPADYTVKVVREDPVNPNLLYAGTEFGIFMS